MSDHEKLTEFISRLNEQMSVKSEEQKALQDTYEKLMETFKTKIGKTLSIWEKDIESGKITDSNTIQGIKGLRERYNAMFADTKAK